MSSTTVSYADVIKDIDDFYVENCVEAYAPTLDKKLKFKPLSVSQMKRLSWEECPLLHVC